MAEQPRDRSHEEHEFWERQFDRPPGASRPLPRRSAFFDAEPWWRRGLERVRDHRSDPRVGVVVLVLVAVVAGFAWYRIGVGGGTAGAAPNVRTPATASAAATTTSSPAATGTSTGTPGGTDARIVVHVAGAVVRAGVVELPADARVIDAVEAVGGATAEGDLDRLNLAARVVDGARVYVAKRGEADPGVLAGSSDPAIDPGGAARGTPSGASPSPTAKVNLNTATQEQLETLPGIGPTYAQAIIAARASRGGFASVNELREVRGIGDKRFADLAPLVTV